MLGTLLLGIHQSWKSSTGLPEERLYGERPEAMSEVSAPTPAKFKPVTFGIVYYLAINS